MSRRFFVFALLALLAAPLAAIAQQSAWPGRVVRIISTSPPGGTVDLLSRILADDFTKTFGQPFIVENRPGGNGNVGADAVVKAPADGHMLFVTIPGVFSINAHLLASMPFNPRTDIAPVAMLGFSPLVLVVHPSVQAKNLQELLAWLRERPGKASYSSQGVGTTGHLAMELLKSLTGVDAMHVPYKGAAAATTDLLAGNVALTFVNTTAALPYVQKGQLRAIAVGEKRRIAAAPEIPTVAESGVPGFEVTPWFGLGTRAGVPKSVVDRLNAETARALRHPETVTRLANLGIEPRTMTPEAFAEFVRGESEKWGDIIRRSGAKVD